MKKLFGFLSVLLIISNYVLNAQWVQTNGPSGGQFGGANGSMIWSLAISGSNVFAGTYEGIYRSTNNGKNWTTVNNGLIISTNNSVTAFAVSGTNILAGIYGVNGGGVYLSTNNGTNWTAVNNGLTNTYIETLAVSGTNLFAGTDDGLFLSTNNGTNWTSVNDSIKNNAIVSIVISGNNVFAGTNTGRIFLSTNSGTSWTQVFNDLKNSYVKSLVVSGGIIFASTWDDGIFQSTDNGANWTKNGLTNYYAILSAPSGENLYAWTYYGVFFLSTDNGTSWKEIDSSIPNSQHITTLAVSGSYLFAGTTGGVFLSTDNGATWSTGNNGSPNTYIHSLAASGTNLFAAVDQAGVSLSSDNGSSWAATNNGLSTANVYTLTASGNNLFAGTSGGVFLSTDNGSSWTAINNGIMHQSVTSFAFSGTNIFAGTSDVGSPFGNIYISTNNGTNWTEVAKGIPDGGSVSALAISGTNIFAGILIGSYLGQVYGEGVFLSTNNGANWSAVNNWLGNIEVTSLVVSGTNLFAGTFNSGVFLTTDNGANWNNVSNGLLNNSISCLAVSGTNLFAGTPGGVFISTDNGKNWASVNDGLTDTYITSFVVSGANLFLGTLKSGVWSRSISEMITGIKISQKTCPGIPTITYAGQTYNTVQIGNQCWLKENLNVGTMILGAQNQTNNGNIEKYCYNDSTIYCDKYGGLYQWGEMTQYSSTEKVQGICPIGWHIPTISEFRTLSSTVKNDGNSLKAIGQGYDGNYSGTGFTGAGTNTSGFSAILSGCLQFGDKFLNQSADAYFWTTTDNPLEGTYIIYLSANSGSIGEAYQSFEGFSVRCVNDNTFTGVEESKENEINVNYLLSQNYPNPFNPTTTINYSVPKSGFIKIKVYDLLGREVAQLVNEYKPAGNFSVQFNASKLVSGIYFYRMESGSFSQTKKLLLLK